MILRRVAPWAAFLTVHALVAASGWMLPSQPMGDVVLVYQPWSAAALRGDVIVGITEAWVYPQPALIPMLLAQLVAVPFTASLGAADAYLIGWVLLVTAGDAVAFGMLLGRGTGRGRLLAAWFWVAALLLLGPVTLFRIDAITVPLAVIGGLWIARRPALGALMLTAGAWIKIWPGALLAGAVAAGRRPLRLLVTAASVTAAIVAVLLLCGAGERLLGFLGEQTGRGLQIEAVAATPFLWAAMRGQAGIEYSFDILTFQISAPAAAAVAAATTPIMVVAVGGILLLGIRRARLGAPWQRLLPPLALALVAALIVTNKVGSPQFETWLIPPVILWIVYDRRRALSAAVIALLLCVLTFGVYPLTYDGLLAAAPLPVLLLSVRNAMLVVLLVVAVRAVLRTPLARPTTPSHRSPRRY